MNACFTWPSTACPQHGRSDEFLLIAPAALGAHAFTQRRRARPAVPGVYPLTDVQLALELLGWHSRSRTPSLRPLQPCWPRVAKHLSLGGIDGPGAAC
jgi:hypothetical protein